MTTENKKSDQKGLCLVNQKTFTLRRHWLDNESYSTNLLIVENWNGQCFRVSINPYLNDNFIKYIYTRRNGKLHGDLIELDGSSYVNRIVHYKDGVIHGCDAKFRATCDNAIIKIAFYDNGKFIKKIENDDDYNDLGEQADNFDKSLNIIHDIATPSIGKFYPCAIPDGINFFKRNKIDVNFEDVKKAKPDKNFTDQTKKFMDERFTPKYPRNEYHDKESHDRLIYLF